MILKEYFSSHINSEIIKTIDNQKSIKYNTSYGGFVPSPYENLSRLNNIHVGIDEFYYNMGDGYLVEWDKNKSEGVGGNMKLVGVKSLFEDDLSDIYDEEMIEENEDIQYFRPFDYATPEAQCGFVIKPEEIYSSVYYNQAGRSSLHNLDLDYEGYTQMALEARVFYHWQVVLLHYSGWGFGEQETIHFKKHMPEIFPDWTWEKFIARYEELRLSNKK